MKKQNIADLALPHLEKIARVVDRADWRDRETYANWLAQTYYFVCHSTRLLCAAAARFRVDRDEIHCQLAGHVHEEKHHDRLARNDLKALGLDVTAYPELSSTKNVYRSPYFLIEHEHPISFYGYVYLLEVLSLYRGGHIMRAAESAFGPKAVTFLKLHVNADEGHIQTYRDFIDNLPPHEFALVLDCVANTADNYVSMVEEILEASAARSTRKSA